MKKINFTELTDKEIITKLSADDYEGGNILLTPNASLETKVKYQVGKAIFTYQLENKLSLEQVAKKLAISTEKLYDICRGKINNFSLTELVGYLEKLSPDYEVRLEKNNNHKRIFA